LSPPWYGVVIAAVITGILGLVSGVISLLLARRNETRQAAFQQKLDNLTKEQDARRSYEFDARKRLYTEVRPLLFQISEQGYSGLDRIKRALMGQVALDRNVGSSALRIFAPIVLGRELQQRLTSVDLTLDQSIRLQYMIVRELQHNLHAGRAVAAIDPKIPYREQPYSAEPRGHMTWSQLERAVEFFTVREPNGHVRPLRQGELDERMANDEQRTKNTLMDLEALFGHLPINSSRILVRLLFAQASLLHVLIHVQATDSLTPPTFSPPVAPQDLRWPELDATLLQEDAAAAQTYVGIRLQNLSPASVVEGADLVAPKAPS
jgi:hypothetical protein